ncbi:MAG: hypothetical protein RL385_38 [Pseudomonadota bacterium]|jgi:hypothetical protein
MKVNHRAITVSLSLEEYELLHALYSRLRRLDVPANNSTPFRAGIRTLMAMSDDDLLRCMRSTPAIPRGPRTGERVGGDK